ncbi:uncharacterized protein LOC110703000 [Chenopodium quinoa]|uniref:uncharacterized protein LOC110703000 n=1 Tax=Chenopodium quinoa TaxID=63459 RepID=UPI000B79482E|nr:uncharacterized protein LOC110703000 [Chenopodium quinoa]
MGEVSAACGVTNGYPCFLETELHRVQDLGDLLSEFEVAAIAKIRISKVVWAPIEGLIIRTLSPNLYAFQFFYWRDKEKVFNGRSWCWDNNLIVLNEVHGDEQPEQVNLQLSPFWVRVCKLPFNCRSDEYVKALVTGLGELIELEPDALGLNRYRRVQVLIDVDKPLRRYQRVGDKGGNEIKIEFKYERLPYLCFACGVIGHSEKDCLMVSEEEKEKRLGWGLFLRASPRKGKAKELRR